YNNYQIVLMNSTDEVLTEMEYVDDCTFTCHVDIDNTKAGGLSFYAKDTISGMTTNAVYIKVFDEFTEEDIAKMQVVDNAIAELKQTEAYINAGTSAMCGKRRNLILNLLEELQEEGLITGYSDIDFDSMQIKFNYHTGKTGVAYILGDKEDNPEPDPNLTPNTTESSEDIAKKQEVDNAIAELKQSEIYQNASNFKKQDLVIELLYQLQEKGLIKEYWDSHAAYGTIEFYYHDGTYGIALEGNELSEIILPTPTEPEPMPTNPTPTEPEPMPTNPTPPEPTTEINYNQVYFYDIWQYKLNATGITITACDRDVTGEITVPNEIDGKTVTAIGEHTFYGCTRISGITLPDTVQEIGKQAFYQCMSLESVNIPDGVPAIEDETFLMCRELKAIELPSSVTSIGVRAFTECQNLIKVQLPEDVASIGAEAFMQCSSLEEINIPHPVTEIAENTFLGCTSLKKMTLFGNVHKIGKCAFLLCNLETLLIDDYNCEIDESFATMSGSRDTVFIGYTGSTTQEFAETYGYEFQPLETQPQPDPDPTETTDVREDIVFGDADGNGELDILDIIVINKAILGQKSLTKSQAVLADVDESGIVDTIDSLNIM
ncbi:MAG: leucine-rich repeat protein, partial [Oscillospiraceae bacterium]|nr:leucine-rich repeat protein [Oscillospiraceae bacterium]